MTEVHLGDLRMTRIGYLFIVVGFMKSPLSYDNELELVSIFFLHNEMFTCWDRFSTKNCLLVSRIK
jgi:hypothetical protein